MDTIAIETLELDKISEVYPGSKVKNAWFAIDSDLVCWIQHKVDDSGLHLWSIETRPGYLNNGIARKSLEILKNFYKVSDILHDGGYTPQGEIFIAKYLKHIGDPRDHLSYPPTNFVKNWDYEERSI